MGLLSQGSPLSWEETKRHADHVRRHGILQFLHIYHAVKDRHKDVLKWGDEVSAHGLRPRLAPLSGHPAPPLFCEARPGAPRWSVSSGVPLGSSDELSLPSPGARPGCGALPEPSHQTSPSHSFILNGFPPLFTKTG